MLIIVFCFVEMRGNKGKENRGKRRDDNFFIWILKGEGRRRKMEGNNPLHFVHSILCWLYPYDSKIFIVELTQIREPNIDYYPSGEYQNIWQMTIIGSVNLTSFK